MISLFSSSSKASDPIELKEDANRARLQAVIERVIQMPEVAITDEMQRFFAHEAVSEKAEAAVDPWDALKDFVREEMRENAA